MILLHKIISDLNILILVFSVVGISYICLKEDYLVPITSSIRKIIKNDKIYLGISSAILGILPIPNRISIVCSSIDMVSNGEKPKGLPQLAYLSTHHYYLWSPMEKSVLISMAILSISYIQFISMLWMPILAYFIFYGIYVYSMDPEDLRIPHIDEMKFEYKPALIFIGLFGISVWLAFFFKSSIIPFAVLLFILMIISRTGLIEILKNMNWKLISLVGSISILGTLLQHYLKTINIMQIIPEASVYLLLAISFVMSFILGSSSRYSTIAASVSSVVGISWFPLFYIVDFCGYIISPIHKCALISVTYFKTRWKDMIILLGSMTIFIFLTTLFHKLFV